MMAMQGLRRLHQAMRQAGDVRAHFQITHNRIAFDCLFLVDLEPYELVLAAIGYPDTALVLPVLKGYLISSNFGDDYKRLARLFNTGKETFRPFQPTLFLREIDRAIPATYRRPTHVDVVRTYRHHVEEGDKPYFLGWLDNARTPPNRVSAANLDKTRRCFGKQARDLCDRANLSSRWTADPDRAKNYFPPNQ